MTLDYFSDLYHAHTVRVVRPDDINDSPTIVALKGVAEDDYVANPVAVLRCPDELRIFVFENAGSKIGTEVAN